MEYTFIGSVNYIEDLANIDIRNYPYDNPSRRLMAVVKYNCENEENNDHLDNPDFSIYIYYHEHGKWILSPINVQNKEELQKMINSNMQNITSIKLNTELMIKALESATKKYKYAKKKINNATRIICIKIIISIVVSIILGAGGSILLYEIISGLFK